MDQTSEEIGPIANLPGVGQRRAELLKKLKIRSLEELLLHAPRRYEDRTQFRSLEEAEENVPILFRGTVQSKELKQFRQRRGSVLEVVFVDGTSEVTCRWWNQPFRARTFSEGTEYLVFGKPSLKRGILIDQPELELIEEGGQHEIHMNRIVPIYPLTQGVTQRWLRELMWNTLQGLPSDPSTDSALAPELSGLDRTQALHQIHFPESLELARQAKAYFIEAELLAFQIKLQTRRLRFQKKATAPTPHNNNRLVHPAINALKFELTKAQQRVMREIREDLNNSLPMRRLLQGDVGSGKTVVAVLSALIMLESGYDVALMAPTELVATQHYETARRWLAHIPEIEIDLCTANHKPLPLFQKPRLTVGTHALLEAGYQPSQLGLVIIDEQHRFGVSQRDRLLKKGKYPHLLAMTATPIPRSLGLTVFGDLDHSIIDELPAHRRPIKTYIRQNETLDKIWAFIEDQIKEGRQAYVIYPRIQAEGTPDLKSVESELRTIQQRFPQLVVEGMHGQIDRDESALTMERFRQNEIQILVATSMIEVGVNVPNATIMLIENAERFGLAQLHQMRGRVGRGTEQSYCILVTPQLDEASSERLKVLEKTNDGFAIAEEDMRLRGPGEFLGEQQSGVPRFRFASLTEDFELLSQVRQRVRKHLGLDRPPVSEDA